MRAGIPGHGKPNSGKILRPVAVWLVAACVLGAGSLAMAPPARAQGTLTAPAGEPRATAPGGLSGRAVRSRRFHARHGSRPARMHRRH